MTLFRDLKELLKVTAEKVELRFPDSVSKYSALAGVLVLRFFAPTIISPTDIGIHDIEDQSEERNNLAKRTLILISKVLQNSSTGVEFGKKEKFFHFYNDHLNENKEKFRKYFEEMITLNSSETIEVSLERKISQSSASAEVKAKKEKMEIKQSMKNLIEYFCSIKEDVKKEFSKAPWFAEYSEILEAYAMSRERKSRRTVVEATGERPNAHLQRPKSMAI